MMMATNWKSMRMRIRVWDLFGLPPRIMLTNPINRITQTAARAIGIRNCSIVSIWLSSNRRLSPGLYLFQHSMQRDLAVVKTRWHYINNRSSIRCGNIRLAASMKWVGSVTG